MYWARTEQAVFPHAWLTGCGKTVEAAKRDLNEAYSEALASEAEQGRAVPARVSFEYRFDLQSFFDYFRVFNASEVARLAGINPSQMRQYKSGAKKAGQAVYERLAACFDKIKSDMASAHF